MAEGTQTRPEWGHALWRDPMWILVLVVLLLASAPLLAPILSPDTTSNYATYFADLPLTLVVLLTLERSRRAARGRRERRFWLLWMAAISCWMGNSLLYLPLINSPETRAVELTADMLNLLYYVFAFLAVSCFPHLQDPTRGEEASFVPQVVGTVLFCASLLTYFVLLPVALAPEVYSSYVPSYLMYVTLDLLLLLAFIRLVQLARGSGWRDIYLLITATAALWLVLDAAEFMLWTSLLPWVDPGTPLDAVWFLPYLPIAAAACVQARQPAGPVPGAAPDAADAAFQTRSNRALLLGYASALPILHFAGYALGWSDMSLRQPREACLFIAVGLLALLALLAHNRLELERDMIEARVREQKNRLRALSQRLARAHEDERRQIARELHDEIGQRLTGLRLSIGALKQSHGGDPSDNLDHIQEEFSGLQKQVRDMSLNLRPSMLDDHGLIAALNWLFRRLREQTGLEVTFETPTDPVEMPDDTQIAAYRIVQEALTNIIRHAGVGHATVVLKTTAREYLIEVSDHGRGFAPERLGVGQISGLDGMYERADLLGGTLQVRSSPGAGTTIALRLPAAS